MVWFKLRIQISYNYCGSVSIFIILMFHLVLDTRLPPCHRHTPDMVLGPFTTISCWSIIYFCRQTYSIYPKDKSKIVTRMLVPDTKILQPKKNQHVCLIRIYWPQKQVEEIISHNMKILLLTLEIWNHMRSLRSWDLRDHETWDLIRLERSCNQRDS